MNKNVSNDDCVRCGECGCIYEANLEICPNCQKANTKPVSEDITSSKPVSESVFNLND